MFLHTGNGTETVWIFNVSIKKIKRMEAPGIDPGPSHMLSERSTIWATPPIR